jgi:hypothetical protein
MSYQIVEKNNRKYIKLNYTGSPIRSESDAMDLLSACGENDSILAGPY